MKIKMKKLKKTDVWVILYEWMADPRLRGSVFFEKTFQGPVSGYYEKVSFPLLRACENSPLNRIILHIRP